MKKNLKEGQVVKGIVRSIQNYGAFIEIGGGVVALLHIEDISIARMKSPLERLSIGQKIDVMIKNINKDSGRIFLTYKELLGTFEENVKEFKEGDIVEGTVRNRIKTGVFVELKPNVIGIAEHVNGIEPGQKVLVSIRKINLEKKKIKLIIIG